MIATRNAFIGALASAVIASSPLSAAEMDLAAPLGENIYLTTILADFAQTVDTMTDGEVKINVHSGGSLMPHAGTWDAVGSGEAAFGQFYMPFLSGTNALFALDALPLSVDSYAEAEQLWAASRPYVEEVLADRGLTVLFAVPWPLQGIYAGNPVTTADDLAGLRMRTQNSAIERFAMLAGATPVSVSRQDIPARFREGAINAMMTSPNIGTAGRVWDYISHYVDLRVGAPKMLLVANTEILAGLSTDQRLAIMSAAATAEETGWVEAEKVTEEATAELARNGIEIVEATPELSAALASISETMTQEWLGQAGDAGSAILENFASWTQ